VGNLLYNHELQLERFAEFLVKQQLVPEPKARFHVYWVRKFLGQGVTIPVASLDDRIAGFLRDMEATGSYKDWQVTQAEHALRLYFVNFKTDVSWSAPTVPTLAANPDGTFDRTATMEALRTQLRLKHYSYSTERTYVDWAGRFFAYLAAL
jgi:hypothetical protein